MLRELRIKNLAVIEEVTVPFAPGLNVLTGETGAGKSILIDAILLLLGGRAQPELIRAGADGARIEAIFDVDSSGPIAELLSEAGLELDDGQLILKRELSRSGRNRAFVNDSPCTLALLDRIGAHLVELHGQHEHQLLLHAGRQLDLLDQYADAVKDREAVAALVREWQSAREELDRLRESERDRAQREDLYRFQLSEIDAARLQPGEEETLRAERQRLLHAERLAEGLAQALGTLYDDRDSALTRFHQAEQILTDLGKIDPDLSTPTSNLVEARVHLEEAVAATRSLRDRVTFDPGRLEEIDARLDVLAKLKRKYGESGEAVLAHREKVADELGRMERHDEAVAALEERLNALATRAASEALALSAKREEAAHRLERLVQKEIRGLGMEKATFRVSLSREPGATRGLIAGEGGWRVTQRGVDQTEFFLSANPGEELKALSRVVSGGELSRTMLGLKVILPRADQTPSLVFDEVDAGIGGRIADVVGQRLRRTAEGRQVLCVTHLPQIAAYGHHHLLVTKSVRGSRTQTAVIPLDDRQQVEELARMLGGEQVTETARRHAKTLYAEAQRMV
jgi:DNA repair protein RecN (Recombination protein N)